MRAITIAGLLFMSMAATAQAQDVGYGQELYLKHCATCHGLTADGNGPMAPALVVQPKDLTVLAKENNGDFPLLRVIRRIDGREPLVSHGSAMPVYGEFFEGDDTAMKTASGQPVLMSRAIADLVSFLISVQR